jgi:hypothetical protein
MGHIDDGFDTTMCESAMPSLYVRRASGDEADMWEWMAVVDGGKGV